MKVYKLTKEQADFLKDQARPDGSRYNTGVIDADGNIIISKEQWLDAQIGEEIEYNPASSNDEF